MEDTSLDLVRANLALNGLSAPCEYLKWGDFSSAPLKEGSFDLIVGSDIIYTEYAVEALAKTIRHYLKPGARAIITNNAIRYDSRASLFEGEVAAAGLTIVERHDLEDQNMIMRLLIIEK